MPEHKGGKKNRKHGRGIEKLSHSRWRSYAGLIGHQKDRRIESMMRRFCDFCKIQFHSRGVFNRHDC